MLRIGCSVIFCVLCCGGVWGDQPSDAPSKKNVPQEFKMVDPSNEDLIRIINDAEQKFNATGIVPAEQYAPTPEGEFLLGPKAERDVLPEEAIQEPTQPYSHGDKPNHYDLWYSTKDKFDDWIDVAVEDGAPTQEEALAAKEYLETLDVEKPVLKKIKLLSNDQKVILYRFLPGLLRTFEGFALQAVQTKIVNMCVEVEKEAKVSLEIFLGHARLFADYPMEDMDRIMVMEALAKAANKGLHLSILQGALTSNMTPQERVDLIESQKN